MFQLNNEFFVQEIQSILESFTVSLNLLYDSQFKLKVHKNHFKSIVKYNYTITITESDSETYVVRVLIFDNNELEIILDKDRFKDRLYLNRNLKGLLIHTSVGLANSNKRYWNIYANNIEDLNRVLKVIDKLMQKNNNYLI